VSSCDWQGMGVFGVVTQVPGPEELPSTSLTTQSANITESVSLTQDETGVFTSVKATSTDALTVTLNRASGSNSVLVTVNLSGRVTGGFEGPVDLAFKVMVGATEVPTEAGGQAGTELALVRTVHADLTPGAAQAGFEVSFSVLVGPELLSSNVPLDFAVFFQFLPAGSTAGTLVVDPKLNALVIEEIGPKRP